MWRCVVSSSPDQCYFFCKGTLGKTSSCDSTQGKPYVFFTWCHKSHNPQFCFAFFSLTVGCVCGKARSVRLSWSTTQTCQKPSLLSLAVLPGRCHGKSFLRDLWLFRIWEILPDSIWQHLSLMSWSLKHPQQESDRRCSHGFQMTNITYIPARPFFGGRFHGPLPPEARLLFWWPLWAKCLARGSRAGVDDV